MCDDNEDIDICRPNVHTLSRVAHTKMSPSPSFDLVRGMHAGKRMLSKMKVTKTSHRILLVITDGESPLQPDAFDELDVLVSTLASEQYSLFILMTGASCATSSVVKQENSKLFASVAAATNGRYLAVNDVGACFALFSAAPGITTTPRPTKISLHISPHLVIPCVYWSELSKVTAPSLKKQAKSASTNDNGSGDGAAAKRDTSYRNPDDPDEEVFAEDRVKGYKYGPQYIPISTTTTNVMASVTEEQAFVIPGEGKIEVSVCVCCFAVEGV